jgi:hypothetical protein
VSGEISDGHTFPCLALRPVDFSEGP